MTPDAAAECLSDPLFFGREILGHQRWSWLEEIRRAIPAHRFTTLVSANGMGKTCEVGAYICEWLVTNPYGRVICCGPTEGQVKGGLWQEMKRAHERARDRGHELGGEPGETEWKIATRWDAAIVPLSSAKKERAIAAIQGRRGDKVLIVMDEAQGVNDAELWRALKSLMTAEGSRFVSLGNPLFPAGMFHENATSGLWHVLQASAFDHPNVIEGREVIPGAVTKLWVDERRADWGEDSPAWQGRVLGVFPDSATNQIVTASQLEKACSIEAGVDVPRSLSLDVARFGSDYSVLGYFDETRTLVRCDDWQGHRTTESAGRVRKAMELWGVTSDQVRIDVGGVGGGVCDRLAEDGMMVDEVDFGAGAQDDWPYLLTTNDKFANRRAELHFAFGLATRHGLVKIPAAATENDIVTADEVYDQTSRFQRVRRDLVVPTYTYDGKGRIIVEDKERIRKRIGRSPDHGDMAVIALSQAGTHAPQAIQL